MRDLISKERIKIARERNIGPADFRVTILLLFRLIKLGRNFIVTKWRLRSCQTSNGIQFTRRRPDIENAGTIKIGHLVRIWSNVRRTRLSVKKGGVLTIGDNCRINGSTIAVTNQITIGNNCRIAPDVYLMDGDFHAVDDRLSAGKSNPIIIEDNAWVATRAMVMKGVTIGEGAVVAAGAVVTKDVQPYTMVAGVPAKFVKNIERKTGAVKKISGAA
jgi:acetyltransferase-like isoleucine patch superfamily enzyme